MTQTSEPLTASVSAPPPRWAALRVSALAAGAVAAGLGLGGIAAAVLMLWIGSPFPDTSLGGALHVGADLWLLTQGADLVRTDTLSGDPAPVAVAPLLLSVLPAWLVFRGTSSAVAAAVDGKDADGPERATGEDGSDGHAGASGPAAHGGSPGSPGDDPDGRLTGSARLRAAAAVTGWVLAGYLTLAAIVVVYATGGSVHVDPLTALYVLLFSGTAAGCGAWAGCGRPGPERLPLDRFRGARLHRVHRAYAEEVGAAVRAAAMAGALLVAGGALIGAAALVWHMGAVGQTYQQLSAPLVGRVSVLLLAVGLVPNLAVWAASYALGVGFAVGTGTSVAPTGASGHLLLPGFPLLAALPDRGTSWVGWTTLAVPALVALAVAWFVGNDAWPVWSTVRVTAGASLVLGAGFAVLAAWSGGALGLRRLADFGPAWWLAGAAAAGWTLVIAVPAALVLRYHVAHPPHPWRSLVGELRVPRPRMPDVSWARLRRSAGSGTGEQGPSEAVSPAPPGPPAQGAPAFVPKPAPSAPTAFPPPLPGLAPTRSDPLPWPNPAPLPLFPPPLPDLPPSAPPAPPAPPAAPPTPVPPRPADPPAEPSTRSGAEPPVQEPVKSPANPPEQEPVKSPAEPPVQESVKSAAEPPGQQPAADPPAEPATDPSADSPAEPSVPPAPPAEPPPAGQPEPDGL
ncbi:DUF6350 family protein [Streptomyces sp. NBC_00669]|uniref:cell division protein PerM n=1 Tax=Streptomyces sp. NBC_00669 TaxID=2976011 RepID=UPI002E373E8B|nr:DUF6350 family protein [Streptomyces sp. NBC_00669]